MSAAENKMCGQVTKYMGSKKFVGTDSIDNSTFVTILSNYNIAKG
jgi:hypothetical protein